MARADLLTQLVQAGVKGDKVIFNRTVEALIAEERKKGHLVLANKLVESLKNESLGKPSTPLLFTRGGEQSDTYHEVIPKVKFSDLVLRPQILSACQELVQEQFRANLLKSYGLPPRNRVLLIGPPGNGKTSLAEALAESLMVPMYVVRYENVIGSYLGETATRLKRLFEYVSSRHCVLFFDEFDTLGKERGDTHETGEIKRVVSSLLLQIDALPDYVVVVAATNHSELLDRAVWRRFQIKLNLDLPTRAQISEYLVNFADKVSIELGSKPEILARKLQGCNFSEISDFCSDVYRKYVLSLPDSNRRALFTESLNQWLSTANNRDVV